MTIRHETARAVERVMQMVRLAHSSEHDLLIAQADAVAPGTGNSNGSRGSDISDPTFRATYQLAPFAEAERKSIAAWRGVLKALDEAERVHLDNLALTTNAPNPKAEPRCPGWNEELQARLGGCGKHLETYRANGVDHIRSTWLCVGCRRAKQRAETEEAVA